MMYSHILEQNTAQSQITCDGSANMDNTFDKIKRAFRGTAEKTTDSAEKVADPDVYTGSNNANENRE